MRGSENALRESCCQLQPRSDLLSSRGGYLRNLAVCDRLAQIVHRARNPATLKALRSRCCRANDWSRHASFSLLGSDFLAVLRDVAQRVLGS